MQKHKINFEKSVSDAELKMMMNRQNTRQFNLDIIKDRIIIKFMNIRKLIRLLRRLRWN